MEANEQYFPAGLFIMLYKVVLTFVSVVEILSVSIQMQATKWNVSFATVCKLFFKYRIYSIKRRGLFEIFRDSSAAFIRGRRLFKIQFISYKQ